MSNLLLPLLTAGALLAVACTAAPAANPAPKPTLAPPAPTVPAPTPKPGTKVEITRVTPGKPGSVVTVTAKTSPEALCNIQYNNPIGLISAAPGLDLALADAEGNVAWRWQLSPDSPIGAGKVKVQCNGTEATAELKVE